jgi:hypothetical protein
MTKAEQKILEEIKRYHLINNYITEQEVPPPPGGDVPPPPGGDVPPPPGGEAPAPDAGAAPPPPGGAPAPDAAGGGPTPVDPATDPDVEEVGKESEEEEELDITDLVNSQKNIETKQEEYFDNLFNQLKSLEDKLAEMDNIVASINNLETKVEKYRPKTAQEKLELRTLDSGPFKQKLSDFFVDKQQEMEKAGKNEYVLTTDDVEDFSPKEIEDSFHTTDDEDDFEY